MYNKLYNYLKEDNLLNIEKVIKYINYEDIIEEEKKLLNNYDDFIDIFNKYYLNDKKFYYSNNSFHSNSRFNNYFPEWMLERIILIDLFDSMNKFYSPYLLNFLKKREKKISNE